MQRCPRATWLTDLRAQPAEIWCATDRSYWIRPLTRTQLAHAEQNQRDSGQWTTRIRYYGPVVPDEGRRKPRVGALSQDRRRRCTRPSSR
jgi:hypothetical protein